MKRRVEQIIIITAYCSDDGPMFIGTREDFRDCFFSNADNATILDWCKQQAYHAEFFHISAKKANEWCKAYMKRVLK